MSVMIVTSLGDMVVDLFTDRCPLTCKNFLKLCKMKYYNGCLFHTVQKDFTAQTGDPTGTSSGGDSVYKYLYGEQARFFGDEIHLDLKHSKTGTLAMVGAGENLNASQFYVTLRDDLGYLDGKHTVFGELVEGLETLNRINEVYVDKKNRPYKNIRIKHTYIVDDPFDDPPELAEFIPDASPQGKPKDEVDDDDVRLEDDWVPMDESLGVQQLYEVLREKEAHSRAVVLEAVGDIPEAEIKPPDNVLFVCKLNPVTEDKDLHIIFSRFGTVTSADIIRDYKTGDSLCYAFIEFEDTKSCEEAYGKMANALIDDRRIHVDFSQSVAKQWSQFRRRQTDRAKCCSQWGSLDHIAKTCTGDRTEIQQHSKYVLKDGNTWHGNSSYDMIFEGDDFCSTKKDKLQRENEVEKDKKGLARKRRYDEEQDKRNVQSHSHGHSERSRDQQDTRDRRRTGMDRDYRARGEGGRRIKEFGASNKNKREDARHDKRHRDDGASYRDRKEYERMDSIDMVHRRQRNDPDSKKSYDDGVYTCRQIDGPYNTKHQDIEHETYRRR